MRFICAGLILLGMIMISYEDEQLTFLHPMGKLFLETSVKAVRVSIKATTQLTTTEMSENFLSLNTILTKYKALAIFTSTAALSTKYKTAVQPGEVYLAMAKELFTHLYTFMDSTKDILPQSSCVYTYNLIDKSVLSENEKMLKAKQAELSALTSGIDPKADKDNQVAIESFVTMFNSVSHDWYVHISTVISNLDTLDGLKFPENLKGHLESLACLAGNGIEFETIKVISSTPVKQGLIIELDVGVPASQKEIVTLTPITYNGVQLRGEDENVYFTRETDSTIVTLLNCTTTVEWVNSKAPFCHKVKLEENCKAGLMTGDTTKVLKYCLFKYATPPSAIRLIDNGILIQQLGLTVTNGGKTVYNVPPYVLYSNKEVKVSSEDEELVFPALTNFLVEKTLISRLTAIDILAMHSKCYWDTLWLEFDWTEYIDWAALCLGGLLVPLTFCGICLGCRNKVVQSMNAKKLNKAKRKRNMRETRALLRESRL